MRDVLIELLGVGERTIDVVATDVEELRWLSSFFFGLLSWEDAAEDVDAEDDEGYGEYFTLHLTCLIYIDSQFSSNTITFKLCHKKGRRPVAFDGEGQFVWISTW